MKDYKRIIHIDMDAFYTSVEQRDDPMLKGKAIAVGGTHRGVVAAASYEARKYGVHSAMPSHQALKLCPHLIFVKGRHEQYKKVSNEVMEILRDYTDIIEQVSIDEAYLDVTEPKIEDELTAKEIALEINKRIRKEVGLTASAGVSFTKFLAKVASDYKKPNGLFVIHPNKAEKFVRQLDVSEIPGVGKVNEKKLHKEGLCKGGDILDKGKIYMALTFGRVGVYLYNLVTFQDDNPVKTKRLRKSIGKERTYGEDISDAYEMQQKLNEISDKLSKTMERKNIMGKTVTLKIKYHNFIVNTRSKTVDNYISSKADIFNVAVELLRMPNFPEEPVRLLGIQVSNLNIRKDNTEQMRFDF